MFSNFYISFLCLLLILLRSHLIRNKLIKIQKHEIKVSIIISNHVIKSRQTACQYFKVPLRHNPPNDARPLRCIPPRSNCQNKKKNQNHLHNRVLMTLTQTKNLKTINGRPTGWLRAQRCSSQFLPRWPCRTFGTVSRSPNRLKKQTQQSRLKSPWHQRALN